MEKDLVTVAEPFPELLTYRDLADLKLGSIQTMRRWEREGLLPPEAVVTLPSGRKRFRGSWVRKLLEQRGCV